MTAVSIEPGIRPLCDALNAIDGVKTRWSCEGHSGWQTLSWSRFGFRERPYVVFTAPEAVALEIQKVVWKGQMADMLKLTWWITGNFAPLTDYRDGDWQWCLEPNDYRVTETAFWSPRIARAVRHDRLAIVDLVSSLSTCSDDKTERASK